MTRCHTRPVPELEVETCPGCGAPLTLDRDGRCQFCRAPVVHRRAPFADLPAPARGILRIAAAMKEEPAAARVVETRGIATSMASVLEAVEAAAQRVLDGGLVLDERRIDVKVYTPDELWTFDLAADVMALLVAAPNLPKATRAATRDLLVVVDAGLGTHWCRSMIGNAGAGSEQLRALRDTIPHRTRLRR